MVTAPKVFIVKVKRTPCKYIIIYCDKHRGISKMLWKPGEGALPRGLGKAPRG